ncbi:MAG TPA: hypothetical protein VNO21_09160, partial [Polyangiaceae bacterium]|nr:hypothetical protein [Polyangiaceae bacterium]
RDPGCGSSADSLSSEANAPCTRDHDCRGGLICPRGVCVSPLGSLDAGSDDGGDAGADADAGSGTGRPD